MHVGLAVLRHLRSNCIPLGLHEARQQLLQLQNKTRHVFALAGEAV